MNHLPPLLLEAKLESRIWGGDRLGAWMGLADAPSQLAEAWLVYEENCVACGPLCGKTLRELAVEWGADLLGTTVFARYGAEFPLLAKFLDAADHLSVQVHPDDSYAHRVEAASGFHGKTEAWYIVQASQDCDVIHGLNQPTDRDTFAAAIEQGTVMELLRRIPVEPGMTIFVPAGTVHAINAGVMLFEIQQKSDLTYRVYDYGRPRELHLERALEVIDYHGAARAVMQPIAISNERRQLVQCDYFTMEHWTINSSIETTTSPTTFEILTVIDGALTLIDSSGSTHLPCGSAVVLPASLGAYTLEPQPHASLLRCYAA